MLACPRKRGGRKWLYSISTFVLLLCLSACSQATTPTPTQTNQPPIKIGGTVSLHGDFASDGALLERGYQLWTTWINQHGGLLGRQVRLDILDDGSNPDKVTADYQKLITVDHVNLLFAPFSGMLTVPAATVAKRYGYAMIEGAATEKDTFEHGLNNLFAVSLSAQHYLTTFALYILSLPQQERPTTVAYATSNDTFTQPQVDAVKQLLDANGVHSVLYTTYTPDTTNFAPIAQKIIHSGAQVDVLGTLGVQDLGALMKAFEQQHYNPKALIAASGPDQGTDFTKAVGVKAAEGVFVPNDGWFSGINTFQNDIFTQNYLAQYGGTADGISSDTVQAYSVGQVLQQVVNKAQSIDNASILTELHRGDTFDSLQGPVKFDASGQNVAAIAFLFQWQQGQLIPVFPPTDAQENALFPKPSWN